MDQIGEEAKSRRPWLRAQPVIDGEEGEELALPVVGAAIQGVGEREGCRPKLAQAAHEGRAQISPVWGLVGTRGRRSLRAGVLPMRPQEGFEAAIREPEEVLGADHIAAKLVQGKARFA